MPNFLNSINQQTNIKNADNVTVVRVYKGSGDRPGTPIRGQVIDRSLKYAAGDTLKSQVCSG